MPRVRGADPRAVIRAQVLYPEETHLMQAVGRPDRRVDRMTRMLDWFDRHLPG
jgi:dipeptidyl aminopeptidase/acylaminoacyl peptidase